MMLAVLVFGSSVTIGLVVALHTRLVLTPSIALTLKRIAELHSLVRDGHRLQDHHADTLSSRLHAIEESAARAEREARIVSLQLTDLSLTSAGRAGPGTNRVTPDEHGSRPGPTGGWHGG